MNAIEAVCRIAARAYCARGREPATLTLKLEVA